MSDIVKVNDSVFKKYKDMGDGTFAEVVYAAGAGGGGGGSGSGLTDAQLRATPVSVTPNVTKGAGNVDATTQRVTLASDGAAVTTLTTINNKIPAKGAATSANSSPVVIASDQSPLPVSATSKFLINETASIAQLSQLLTVSSTNAPIVLQPAANGSVNLSLLHDPLYASYSGIVDYNVNAAAPFAVDASINISQRLLGQETLWQMLDFSSSVATPSNINIASISQTTTTLTVTLATALPFGVYVGNVIYVSGVTDTRLNYPAIVINSISLDRLTITSTSYLCSALPSLTVGPFTQGVVSFQASMYGANGGVGFGFAGGNAALAVLQAAVGGQYVVSANVQGTQQANVSNTAPVTVQIASGTAIKQSSNRYKLSLDPRRAQWDDFALNSAILLPTIRGVMQDIKADWSKTFKPRFAIRGAGVSNIAAKIVSAVKAGSTTATVTTAAAHNLVTGNYVTIYGIRDQVNFANQATPVAVTVVDSVTFTVALGASATATAYGGSVVLNHGNMVMTVLAGAAQSVSTDAAGNVTLIGSGTWGGAIGDFVRLDGINNATTGASLGFDGVYQIQSTTTTLVLYPAFDYKLVIQNPVANPTPTALAPFNFSFTSANCGGAVLAVTQSNIVDVRDRSATQEVDVRSSAEGSTDMTRAIPVFMSTASTVNTVSTITTAGTPAAPATVGQINSAASTNGQLILTGTSGLQAFYASNTAATAAYVKLYNKATAPTVGTDTPAMVIPLPAAVGGVPSIVELTPGFNGYRFTLGLGLAVRFPAIIYPFEAGRCIKGESSYEP
jgi:hypothetical protein